MDSTTTIPSATQQTQFPSSKKLVFKGKSNEFFSIYIGNVLLSIITLGIYYPWARVKILKYLYNETEFEGSNFTFHGTGKEIFMGMLKAFGILAVVFGIYLACLKSGNLYIILSGFIFYIIAIIIITPAAIVGSLRYRTSRSEWRGIYFGYRGTYKAMLIIFLKGLFFIPLTLGIYSNWFITNIYKEVLKNFRLGNLKFIYDGTGAELFYINLKGFILTILTLGIYSFRYQSHKYNYIFGSIRLAQDSNTGRIKTSFTGWRVFKLMIGNIFIVLFTVGLGTPWAIIRSINFFINNTELKSIINFNEIVQTETTQAGTTGEGLMDSMDALDLQLI